MQSQPQQLNEAEREAGQKPCVRSFYGQEWRFSARRRGFSLVEILVAVSIIGLLVAIGTAVGVKMNAEARKEQTKAMMEGLLAANTEYKAARGFSIGVNGSSSDSSAKQFVDACLTIKTCEEIMMSALNSSSSASLERIYKNGSVYDRWGTQLEYRQSNNQSGTGPGTNVDNDDLPLSRDPFFASAGPDKEWGTDDDLNTTTQ